jgi:hypothetical protein
VGPVACIGGMRNAYKVLVCKSEEQGRDGEIILKWIMKDQYMRLWAIHWALTNIQWWAVWN